MNCAHCGASQTDGAEICFKCRQPLPTFVGQGTVIANRYEVHSLLGKGGMGAVYRAFDQVLEEDVAIKILKSDPEKAEELARRFRTEIKLARKVRHANVCTIHDYGEDGPLEFISMELVEGENLRAVLQKRGRLTAKDAIDVSVQMFQGLEAIHRTSIVHRDLKPHNMMLQPDGVLRLMDFGIAKRIGADATGQTRTGQLIGTPEYMSPEQGRGERVDFRSDLYSAGVVMYELFTGRVPFKGETPVGTIMKHIQDPPPVDGDAARHIPPSVMAILRELLAKKPEQRPEGVSSRLLELQVALTHARPTSAQPSPRTQASDLQETRDYHMVARPSPRPGPPPQAPAGAPASSSTSLRGKVVDAPARQASYQRPGPSGRRVEPRTPVATIPPTGQRSQVLVAIAGIAVLASMAGAVIAGYAFLRSSMESKQAQSRPATAQAPEPDQPAAIASPESTPARANRALTGSSAAVTPSPRARTAGAPESPPPATARAKRPPRQAQETSPSGSSRPSPPPPTTFTPAIVIERPSVPQHEPEAATVSDPAVSDPTVPASTTDAEVPVSDGFLVLSIKPWANVSIDGTSVGQTPMNPVPLKPGTHIVVLSHPSYVSLQRRVTIREIQTTRLKIDLAREAFKKTEQPE